MRWWAWWRSLPKPRPAGVGAAPPHAASGTAIAEVRHSRAQRSKLIVTGARVRPWCLVCCLGCCLVFCLIYGFLSDLLGDQTCLVSGRASATGWSGPGRRPDKHLRTPTSHSVGPGTLAVRWATVPGGVLVDPAVPVLSARSWVLDLDASQSPGGEFTVDAVADATRWGAETAYTFFRWAMTDHALEMLG